MLPPAQLIPFGDQTVPYRDAIQRLLMRKDSPLLAMLLADGHRALAREIVSIPSPERPEVTRLASLDEMMDAEKTSPTASCALDSALVCLSQIAAFVSYLVDTGAEYPQPSRSVVIGRCIGLLAATAVSCSESIAELVSLVPEMVALAFRIGLLVQTKTSAVTPSAALGSSCSAVIANVDQDGMVSLLRAYCQSEGLPAATSLYLSAVAHDNVTISGPPEHLDRFRVSNNRLHMAPVLIRGLFHAPHPYTLDEANELARDFGSLFHTRPVRLSVLSNADGRIIPDSAAATTAATAADLLYVAIGEILTRPMQWSQIAERAVDMLASHDETIVLPFGAGSSAHAFGRAPGFRIRETLTGERGRKTHSLEQSTRSKIAIIGFSGRYPEAEGNEEFWELLLAGRDVHREIPRDRFDPWLYYDETGKRKNTSGVRHGCFLKNPALFDAKFFGLSPREAEQADPAQRLALMTAYKAMEMAGLVPDASPSTQRDRIGVFYGTASDDYRECNSGQDIDTYFVPGGSRAFLPARINYQWRFSGPSLDVDTACSSSLAALHMACNCLWRGDCDTALAGGTNVLTNPDNWSGLDRAHFLSRTGNCRTFDDGADGYCRSESVSTLVLKRLDDALRDGDPVYGTILGAYTNHSAEAVEPFDRVLPKPQPQAVQSSTPETQVRTSIPQSNGPVPQITSLGTHCIAPSPQGNTTRAQKDDTAARVRALVADEVGVPATELTDNDDLIDLGVDSLLALTMADRIRAEFGVTVPSTDFIEPLTVRGLIQLISGGPPAESKDETDSTGLPSGSMSLTVLETDSARRTASITPRSSQSSLAEWSLEPSPKLPPIPSASSVLLQGDPRSATKTLWLVPDGSGLATSYLALPDIEPSSLAVYALNSPFIKSGSGLQDLCMSQRSFSQLTDAYVTELRRRQPHGPYYLGGWSAGGICAYDIAQRLVLEGETVLRLILIDSPNPISLAKLPARVYDELTRLGVFGSGAAAGRGRPLPSWLLPHFVGFVDILHTYAPQPFMAPRPLQTWAIWAQDGVDDHGSIVIQPEDPPNLHWLLRKRTGASLGTNGWEVLVGKENIHVEVLQEANHFTMLKEPAARRVSSLLAKAMA